MQTIDHDPKERPATKGESIFVPSATIIVLIALAAALRYSFDEWGYGAGFTACGALLIVMFAIAFWLDRPR